MGRAGVEPTRPSRAKLRNGGAAAAAVMVCSLPATKRFYNELSVRAKKLLAGIPGQLEKFYRGTERVPLRARGDFR